MCSICGGNIFNGALDRSHRSCASCGAMERHRYMHGMLLPIVAEKRLLDVAPYSPLIWKGCMTAAGAASCVSVDKWKTGNPLDQRDVSFADKYCDILDISAVFGHGSFDIIVMQQVLDEILDYRGAMIVLRDTLSAGGVAYVEVRAYAEIDGAEPDAARKFGNHWRFGREHLLTEFKKIFDSVELVEYVECGWFGQVFVCRR